MNVDVRAQITWKLNRKTERVFGRSGNMKLRQAASWPAKAASDSRLRPRVVFGWLCTSIYMNIETHSMSTLSGRCNAFDAFNASRRIKDAGVGSSCESTLYGAFSCQFHEIFLLKHSLLILDDSPKVFSFSCQNVYLTLAKDEWFTKVQPLCTASISPTSVKNAGHISISAFNGLRNEAHSTYLV